MSFTQQGNALYATLLGTPASREISICDLQVSESATIQLLGQAGTLHWRQDDDNLTITLPDELPGTPAHCLKILV